MNEETRIFGFAAGLMCWLMSVIGFVVFNYFYLFKPEQHGPNPVRNFTILNFACVFGFYLGWKLMKKCGKPH